MVCPRCQGHLYLKFDLDRLKEVMTKEGLEGDSLWRYKEVLPIDDERNIVSLGEGMTPLLKCRNLGEKLGFDELYIKFEGSNPTGSLKDRTSTTAVSSAKEFGFKKIAVTTSGNAGSSIAAYSSRAGIETLIFYDENTSAAKLMHMRTCATKTVPWKGDYGDVIEHFMALVDRYGFYDGGAGGNPFKHEGKKTYAYEIAEQMGWEVPDYISYPVGVGEALIASHRGFKELEEMGWTESAPKMICAQPTAANAISLAFKEKRKIIPQKTLPTLAKAIVVGKPGKKGDYTLSIINQGGFGEDASDEDILESMKFLAGYEGIYGGISGCTSLACAVKLLREGKLDRQDRVVCVITETGLKNDVEKEQINGIEPTFESWKKEFERFGGE